MTRLWQRLSLRRNTCIKSYEVDAEKSKLQGGRWGGNRPRILYPLQGQIV